MFQPKNLAMIFTALLILFFAVFSANAQKLKVEDVVTKHLEAIGTAENRVNAKNYLFIGGASFKIPTSPNPPIEGRAVFASESDKMLFGLALNAVSYKQEQIVYDGKKPKIGFITPGNRSPLGAFLAGDGDIIANGLLGGVLFKSWSLLNAPETKAKLNLDGTKKIKGVECYVVDYNPRKGSDFAIKLYFDTQTFRHVRTEYKRTISARIGLKPDDSARQQETRHTLVEDFSDFKTVNNLTLPQNYSLLLNLTGQNGTSEYQWNINILEFLFNQKLDAGSFNVEAN
ncbi:MAG: hypothetical protein M3209_20700 [Acidobacteriota bacterium]|nr:hypothetical protein [Acidobacteriota bacterium]